MRSLLVGLAALVTFASQASAQRYYIAPPTAPDMKNPGFYYTNPYGVTYGPNHCVRPSFPPYQGVLPVPSGRGQGQPSQGQYQGHPGQVPMNGLGQYAANPAAFQSAMGKYAQAGGFGGAACNNSNCVTPSFSGFTQHPWARSPRDFFMYGAETYSPNTCGYSVNGDCSGCKD